MGPQAQRHVLDGNHPAFYQGQCGVSDSERCVLCAEQLGSKKEEPCSEGHKTPHDCHTWSGW